MSNDNADVTSHDEVSDQHPSQAAEHQAEEETEPVEGNPVEHREEVEADDGTVESTEAEHSDASAGDSDVHTDTVDGADGVDGVNDDNGVDPDDGDDGADEEPSSKQPEREVSEAEEVDGTASGSDDGPSTSQPWIEGAEEETAEGIVEGAVKQAEDALLAAAAGVAAAVANKSMGTDAIGARNATSSTLPPPTTAPPSSDVPLVPLTESPRSIDITGPQTHVVMLCAMSVVVGLLVWLLLKRLFFGGGRKRRDKTILIGLPMSGKTALFSQLTTGHLCDSRTSMSVNTGTLQLATGETASGAGTVLVDFPGHRRLRGLLYAHLEEAVNVVVTIDAVTVHDDQHEGSLAVSAMLLDLIESPAFYGVRRLLIVATKRDELTSYSIKAVRKLLESAMVRTIVARQGELNRVDKVVDVNGSVVTAKKGRQGSGKKAYLLDVDEHGGFSFEQLGLEEVAFVDASSLNATVGHGATSMSVDAVRRFILRQ